MSTLNVVVASTRPGRIGPTIAEWFLARARSHGGFEVVPVDLATVGLPLLDEPEHPMLGDYRNPHTREWSACVAAADAFVFVMPEYNYGLSAGLKNAIDYLYAEWAYKPAGFVSYGMASAGLNAVAMLRQVITPLKMAPVSPGVAVPLRDQVDADGVLHPSSWMEDAAEQMLDELQRQTSAMRTLRETAATADLAGVQ